MSGKKVFASKLGLDLSIISHELVVIEWYSQPGPGGINRIRDHLGRIVRYDTLQDLKRLHADRMKISSKGTDLTIYQFN